MFKRLEDRQIEIERDRQEWWSKVVLRLWKEKVIRGERGKRSYPALHTDTQYKTCFTRSACAREMQLGYYTRPIINVQLAELIQISPTDKGSGNLNTLPQTHPRYFTEECSRWVCPASWYTA